MIGEQSVGERQARVTVRTRTHTQVTIRPEMPLASLLGIWGAAFTASTGEVVRSLTGKSCVPLPRGGGGMTGFGRADRSDQTPTVRNRYSSRLTWNGLVMHAYFLVRVHACTHMHVHETGMSTMISLVHIRMRAHMLTGVPSVAASDG